MGDEATDDFPEIYLGKPRLTADALAHSDKPIGQAISDAIFSHYELTNLPAFYELEEALTEIACRDQGSEHSLEELRALRVSCYPLIENIKKESSELLALMESINRQAMEFGDISQWAPPLLEEVFTCDLDNSIFLPEELLKLYNVSRRPDYWSHLRSRFRQLADLPLRRKHPGQMADHAIRRALKFCRAYWVEEEHKEWGMYALKDASVRKASSVDHLSGSCEQFVGNMLNLYNIDFDLHRLNSAWKALEVGARQEAILARSVALLPPR